jgi:hypothetical protein
VAAGAAFCGSAQIARSIVEGVGVVLSFGKSKPDLSAIAAVVAHSPIRVTAQRSVRPDLPVEFGEADVAILKWIVAESRRGRLQPPLH